MNTLEIFQEVYGKDHVFTVTELTRLQKVSELIAMECQTNKFNPDWDAMAVMVEEQKKMAKRIVELEEVLIINQEKNKMSETKKQLSDEEISNAWLFLEGKAAGVLQEGGEFNFPVEFYKYIKELTE